LIHSAEGHVAKAHDYLIKAILLGVTYFEEAVAYFKKHIDELGPLHVKSKQIPIEFKEETRQEVLNMYTAWINELKNDFSAALTKDRLYSKPAGFITDQQIWMLGVDVHYLLHTALRFNHKDFLRALKVDFGPVMGQTGLWVLKNLLTAAKEAGDNELKKKISVALEIVEKYLESGYEGFVDEKKYNFVNKFGPKKCPNE